MHLVGGNILVSKYVKYSQGDTSYYINTNEIPSELTCKNMIPAYVKRSLLQWLQIKTAPFHVLL